SLDTLLLLKGLLLVSHVCIFIDISMMMGDDLKIYIYIYIYIYIFHINLIG
ncbi:MAG: hypothetical protein ACI8RD_009014, partial [Bacillariaceae sp.]